MEDTKSVTSSHSNHDNNQSIDWGSDKDQGETVSLGDEENLDCTIAEAAGFDQNTFIDEHYSVV
ncbi:hypothetical protein GLOTRDRAFT_134514 [Gloeophyllum trabeum ATCC 11539]|uniref:Uncharacterized protein n=1 Tax=Gloeophyllum trabeum (strain ATCC 11539 / FP-39264 / Madison 617) TaxID=670483 RepID=S7PR61_GLOTA|nr:uncharacterized protein GLOTRDRAFT_134514 [Gloeophyllum trabeum ATCC 11539]EPQ49872.1 hypothetical protein GLOTRDRAFT_134514 [Gloeophyllum trabeum ATCC 11539]